MAGKSAKSYDIIGWREWVALPDFGVQAIKAKIDTGARSSALHAIDLERFDQGGQTRVRFQAHPLQRDDRHIVMVEAVLLEDRMVRNSGGQSELRPVVIPIELTLTNRDEMGFRLLLGRQALRRHYWVDPGRSYRQPLPPDPLASAQP